MDILHRIFVTKEAEDKYQWKTGFDSITTPDEKRSRAQPQPLWIEGEHNLQTVFGITEQPTAVLSLQVKSFKYDWISRTRGDITR